MDSINYQEKSREELIQEIRELRAQIRLLAGENGNEREKSGFHKRKSHLPFISGKDLPDYTAILETVTETQIVLFAFDKNGVFTLSEGKGLNKLGLKPGQVVGLPVFEVYKEQPEIVGQVKQALQGNEVRTIIRLGDVYFDTLYSPVFSPDGKLENVVGVAFDVSEQKKVELALRETSESLEFAQRLAHLGSWEMDVATGESVWSDEFFRICGFVPQSFPPTAERGMEIIHPDDRDRASKAVQEAIKNDSNYRIEKRIVRPDGGVRTVLSQGKIFLDPITGQKKLAGSFLDITDQVEYEKSLELSNQRFKEIFESVTDALIITNFQGQIIEVNRKAEELYGYSREEFKKMTPVDFIHPDYRGEFDRFLEEIQKSGFFEGATLDIRKDGTSFESLVKGSLVTFDNVPHLLAVIQDVTLKRKQETEIRRNIHLNQALLRLYELNQLKEKEFIRTALDRAVELSDSEIGYCHFFKEETNEIELVAWSTQTLTKCTAVYDNHYPLEKAGVWADAVKNKRPVIINDYPSLAKKSGLPQGHFPLKSHLGVPIVDNDRVVGIFGVGNKQVDYLQEDIDQLEIYTRSFWEILKGRRAGQQIKKNEEKFRLLFENMNEGFIHAEVKKDEKNKPIIKRYIDVNPVFASQTGLRREEIIESSDPLILPGIYNNAKENSIEIYAEVALSGKEKHMEIFSKALSSWFSVHVFSPRKDEFAATFQDITGRKEAELALQNASKLTEKYNNELKRSNKDLEQFAYIVSHDLQEPLRKIKNYGELLEHKHKEMLDGDAQGYIDVMTRAATRMQILIEDLLTFSRVTSKGQDFLEADLEKSFENVVDNLEYIIVRHGAVIEKKQKLPKVKADHIQIEQVLQNLISNSIKFRGEKAPKIKIEVRELKDAWEFELRDNGIGFKMKYADKIFEVFQRLHSREEYPGTGIGLALCKKIINRHGGRIWVNSTPGVGTSFYFTLPK